MLQDLGWPLPVARAPLGQQCPVRCGLVALATWTYYPWAECSQGLGPEVSSVLTSPSFFSSRQKTREWGYLVQISIQLARGLPDFPYKISLSPEIET